MEQAKAGDFHGAWITLTDHNPFPAVVGRVCHRPCEAACNRGGYDEPLAVRSLERYIGDLALAERWRFPPAPIGQERVAVIGGGPSGLSAAYQLRRRGYAVSIFEAQRELGGLLRDGIPPYRLPRAVLDGEIRRILALGIDVHAGTRSRAPSSSQAARAIRRGVPRHRRAAAEAPRAARLRRALGDGRRGVSRAQPTPGSPPALGKRVVAIGGGSAAMDVARSARRAGHEVSVLSLEREAEMPAQREEVVAAKEEGVRFFDGAALVSVRSNGTLKLHCVRGNFSQNPHSPRPRTAISTSTPRRSSRRSGRTPTWVAALLSDGRCSTSGKALRSPAATSSPRARFVSQAIGMGARRRSRSTPG